MRERDQGEREGEKDEKMRERDGWREGERETHSSALCAPCTSSAISDTKSSKSTSSSGLASRRLFHRVSMLCLQIKRITEIHT